MDTRGNERTAGKLPPDFVSDLQRLWDGEFDFPAAELKCLGAVLERWRQEFQGKLEKELSSLPPDHPILCPVSLYAPMDYGRLEVAHTRTLAWLLDPENEHGFGTVLLEALLGEVRGNRNMPPVAVKRVQAERFYRALGGEDAGRTDVWIEGSWLAAESQSVGKPWLLVIEAKIDATEGIDQLSRYEEEIEKWSEGKRDVDVFPVFLTPKPWKPKTSKRRWVYCSFLNLARIFWRYHDSLIGRPGYHFLRYYIAGILQDILACPTGTGRMLQNPVLALRFLREIESGKGE